MVRNPVTYFDLRHKEFPMVSIRLHQKKDKVRADRKAPVYYVLATGSKRKYIASKKYVGVIFFDNKTSLVLKGDNNSTKLNTFFRGQMTRLDNIIMNLSNAGKEITFDRIEQIFRNEFTKDFISFATDELKKQKGLISVCL